VQEIQFDQLPPAAIPTGAVPTTTPSLSAVPRTAAPKKPNCNPAYTYDAQGTKIYKRECLK
jgi:hypothetical protein